MNRERYNTRKSKVKFRVKKLGRSEYITEYNRVQYWV